MKGGWREISLTVFSNGVYETFHIMVLLNKWERVGCFTLLNVHVFFEHLFRVNHK